MKDFAEIFNLGQNFFGPRGASVSKDDFIADVQDMNLNFSLYERAKYAMIAMLGLKPKNDDEEKEAILSILNYNNNIEVFSFF